MKDEIIKAMRGILYLKKNQISDDTLLEKVIKTSMEVIELIAVLSNKYNVTIKPQEMNNIKTVGDLVKYIEKNKGSKKDKSSLESF